MPYIISIQRTLDFSKVYELFPCLPIGSLNRPSTDIGMLLGQNANALLPIGGVGKYQIEGLRVRQTVLGDYGYVLDGYHPCIWTSAVTNRGNFDMKAVQEGFIQIHKPLIQICHFKLTNKNICPYKSYSFPTSCECEANNSVSEPITFPVSQARGVHHRMQ